jgi:hypothetical protein
MTIEELAIKELIERIVSDHAEMRWMDAGELETLLKSFASSICDLGHKNAIEAFERTNDDVFIWDKQENEEIELGELKERFEYYLNYQQDEEMHDGRGTH